jgi:hypothetical protein
MLPDRRKPGAQSLAGLVLAAWGAAHAQSIEPRSYSPAPVGVNFLVVGLADSRGGLAFDSASPLQNPKLAVLSPLFAYARTFDIGGRLGKVDVILPTGRLSGSADYQGQRVEREVTGSGDPLVRMTVNLVGAPAMSLQEFRSYQQDLVVGASLQVSLPLGQYDPARLLNLGSNRWAFHPELGLSKAFGPWVAELTGGAVFYTANHDFFGGHARKQDPLVTARANLVYNFRGGPWISFDTTFYTGGETTLDGAPERNLQRNWRVGSTLAIPIDRHLSFKVNASRGVSARTGNNFDLVGAALQYRWGAGL